MYFQHLLIKLGPLKIIIINVYFLINKFIEIFTKIFFLLFFFKISIFIFFFSEFITLSMHKIK